MHSKVEGLVHSFKEQSLLLPVWYEDNSVKILNQKKLPFYREILEFTDAHAVAQAIKDMNIRGAGAIGIAATYGIYLEARKSGYNIRDIMAAADCLKQSRPTALNLFTTINEIILHIAENPTNVEEALEDKICEILQRQLDFEYRIADHGAELIADGDRILTHCHSGALAGSGYGGRVISVLRRAKEQGKDIHVYTCETRPYFTGARITVYELEKLGINHTLITDGMSGYLMQKGLIDKVLVGSDRVAANGDLINKVGTYLHAVAAKANNIPFYTATSSHTIDYSLDNALEYEVEYRSEDEILRLHDTPITLEGTQTLHPSFDITPNHLITSIITEKGIILPCYTQNLKKVKQ